MTTSDGQIVDKKKNVLNLPHYAPSGRALEVLVRGRILSEKETPQNLIERVIFTLFSVEHVFGTDAAESKKLAEKFAEYMTEGYAILGTPTLTNAGRYEENALSSCAMIPVDLRVLDTTAENQILSYYRQNMGAGFEFSKYHDPVALLTWINKLAARESATGKYDRYIGNMGLLSVLHPTIKDFIEAKRHKGMRHFNISVNVTEEFMHRVEDEGAFTLADGKAVEASDLLQMMAENAWLSGDPGLIFLDRMNKDNPLESMSKYTYVTTPPCAEIGLAEGETCHFGYVNLRNFIQKRGNTVGIDYEKLRDVIQLLTRVLDNAIEYSLFRYPAPINMHISQMTRSMALGVCGLADVFLAYKFPYDSLEARELARDILSFVTYTAKCASMQLSDKRGSCLAMELPGNKYVDGQFLEDKYAMKPTRTVSSRDWKQLASAIRTMRKLRNISITALAPTGRSSILLDATPSIEPMFGIFAHDGQLRSNIVDFLSNNLEGNVHDLERICQEASLSGSFQHIELLSSSTRDCLKTAKELTSMAHLQMVAEVAGMKGVIDGAASKTVNLPHTATVADVVNVFLSAYHLGLKNISVYRDKTSIDQPEQL